MHSNPPLSEAALSRAHPTGQVLPINGRMFSLSPGPRDVFSYWGWDGYTKQSVNYTIQAAPEIDWSRVLIELLLAASIAGLNGLVIGWLRQQP